MSGINLPRFKNTIGPIARNTLPDVGTLTTPSTVKGKRVAPSEQKIRSKDAVGIEPPPKRYKSLLITVKQMIHQNPNSMDRLMSYLPEFIDWPNEKIVRIPVSKQVAMLVIVGCEDQHAIKLWRAMEYAGMLSLNIWELGVTEIMYPLGQ